MRRTQGSGGGSGFVARGDNNLYAGRDGNIYRRNDSGWQKYGDGSWSSVEPPRDAAQRAQGQTRDRAAGTSAAAGAARTSQAGRGSAATREIDRGTYGQLDRDYSSRSRGAQRSGQYQSWQRGGGRGAYGAGMGARRGGGRRR